MITETFKNSTAPGWVFAGSGYTPTLTSGTAGADGNAVGDGWLRLTTPGTNQATSAYYNTAFTAANATIFAKFDYESYGGTGADGITFFLYDGTVAFSEGAHGGSLGYAQKTIAGGAEYNHAGLAGGYLGIALDEYGNFSSASEGRIGGYNGTTGLVPDAIAVRGPGSGYDGYAYLGGSGTLPLSIDSATRPTQTNTVQLLITATNQLTVTLAQEGSVSPQTVLQMDLSGYARPDTLKFGFSSGTGASTNYHDVRNLNVSTLTANLWSGGAGDGLWASNPNWDPTIVPAVGADILFDNTHVTSAQTIDTGANRTVRSLSFDTPYAYTLNNHTLVFDNQGVPSFSGIAVSQTHGTATNTINSALSLSNAINIRNNSTGTLTLTGALDTNGHALTLDGAGPATTLSGVISDTGAVTKNDSGTVTLSGANTYSGGTTLNYGTLNANHATALGSGAVTLAGGTLASTNGATLANTLALTGDAGLGNLTTTGALTQTGSHTLALVSATHSGAINLSSTAIAQTLTAQVDSGTSTLSGVIADGGGSAGGNLTKTGSGTLELGGANTYTGTTSVDAGTLRLGASDRLADTADLSLAGSGTFDLAGYSERINNLTAADGATINFGASSGANTLLFDTFTGPASGVMVINNWENGLDSLATTINSQTVSSIYFSGYGVAEYNGTASLYGGTRYLLRPDQAVEKEWDGSSSSTWSTNSNWTTSGEPSTTQVALFDDLGIGRTNANMTSNDTIAGIRFGAGATVNYNITGSGSSSRTLTLDGVVPYIQQQSASNQTISIARLAFGANTVADITGAGNLTISSAIYSPDNLIKDGTGAGTLILSGNNTNLTGDVFINNGTLRAAHSNALGTGTATVSGGATLELSGGISPANAIAVSGTGVGGNGAIRNVSGTNTLSGTVTQTGATTLGADTGTTLNLTGNLTGANTATTLAGAGNFAVAQITTGTGGVTLDGTGTTTFNGGTAANTFTGTTTVNAGTLILNKAAGTTALAGNLTVNAGTVQLNASNQIANTSTVTLNNSATLNLNGQTETLGQLNSASASATTALGAGALTLNGPNNTNSSYAGSLTGTAGSSLTVTGTGKVYLSGTGSGYAGTTNVASGTLNVSGTNTVLGSGAVNVSTGGNLQLQGGISLANAVTINGSGTSLNGAIENFAGNNTLTGAITVASASRVNSDAGTLTLSGNIGLGANTLTMGGAGDTNQAGVISGTGGLTKDGAGIVTLSGANAYTGATTVSAGTLRLGASERIDNLSAVSVASGATFDTNGYNETIGSLAGAGDVLLGAGALTAGGDGTSTTFSGNLDGTGSFTKAGAGTLTIASDLSFDGPLNLAGGTLQFDVDNAFTGAVTISAGTLRLSDATLDMDTLNITGNSTIDFAGTASILNLANLNISAGVTLTILNWQNATDYFFAQNWSGAVPDTTGATPMNQIVFTGFTGNDTKWQGYDDQITPVPEPSTYGAMLMGAGLAVFGLRRWRQKRRPARA